MDDNTSLEPLIRALPNEPGVYIMKDGSGTIIYIGKASSLKRRVSSYFHGAGKDGKTDALVRAIAGIEYIVTDSETEALILESSLVKRHMPRYNVRLKDDKRYPSIAVTMNEEYPRVIFTRDMKHEGYRYFGPFTDAGAARRTVATVNRIFKLKTCTRPVPIRPGERPCLNYQMKRCQGVCTGEMEREEYMKLVDNAIRFLDGQIEPVLENLQSLMRSHSDRMEFEKAAGIRDIIFDIQMLSSSQKVYVPVTTDQDYIALSIQEGEALILLFEFRTGAMLGSKISIFEIAEFSTPGDIVRSFISGYYDTHEAPPKICVEQTPADRHTLEDYLAILWSKRITLAPPESAVDRSIFAMMQKNIASIIASRGSIGRDEETRLGLAEIQTLLSLPSLPHAIECFDISHLQGTDSVASMVHFTDGRPEKSMYRRYRMRGHEGINDPAMIHEVVSRRVQYLVNEELELPDLIIIDGGTTQLSRALEAIHALEVPIRIISLAKRFEEIYRGLPGDPIRLPETSPALKILQRARDEAHRFAVTYHRTLRGRSQTRSALDEIPAIGPKTRNLVLRHFLSVNAVRGATLEELEAVPGIGRKTAAAIYSYFHDRGH